MTPYLQFNRSQWAALRDSVPMTLTEGEIARLKGINEDLSLEEVAEIYNDYLHVVSNLSAFQ